MIFLTGVRYSQTTELTLNEERSYHRDYSLIYGIKYNFFNSTENIRSDLRCMIIFTTSY